MPFLFRRLKPGTEKSIRIIEKYYDVDHANKRVRLPLKYDAEDALFVRKYETERPVFNDNVLCSDIAALMRDVPRDYSAEVDVRLDESIPLSAREIGDSLHDALALNVGSGARAFRMKNLTACLLVFTGSFLLWFSYFIGTVQSGEYSNIVSFLFNSILVLSAQAMIWEFIDLILPTAQQDMGDAEITLRRTHAIRLTDAKGGTCSVSVPDVIVSCPDFNKRFARFTQFFLILSLLFFNHSAAGLSGALDILRGRTALEPGFGALYLILYLAVGLLSAGSAVIGCFCYAKRGRLNRVFLICLSLLTAVLITFNLLDYVLPVIKNPAYIAELEAAEPGTFLVDLVNLIVQILYITVSAVFLHRIRTEGE